MTGIKTEVNNRLILHHVGGILNVYTSKQNFSVQSGTPTWL
jgi:hypothetical protein